MPEAAETGRLSVSLKTGDVLAFENLDEVKAFASAETEFWSWLQDAASHHNQLNGPWKQLRTTLAPVVSAAEEARKATDDAQRERGREKVKAALTTLANQNAWIPSSTSRAQYVKQLVEQNRSVAAFCYLWFTQPELVPLNDLKAVEGVLYGWMFQNALPTERATAERNALQDVRSVWERFSGAAKNEYSTFRTQFEGLAQSIEKLTGDQAKAFAEVVKSSKEKLDAIEATYDQKLALQQPVAYWTDREARHKKLSIGYAVGFVAATALVVGCVYSVSLLIVPELWDGGIATGSDATRDMPHWRLAILAVTAGFFVWPVRIISRLLLSNLHLWMDAGERAVMANAYLALQRSEAGLSDTDRKVILEVLFRPSATGIVKEDGMSAGVLDLLSRSLGGR